MTPGLWVAGVALAGSSPRLDAPTEAVPERGAVVLVLSGGGSIFIDSCAPVELEQKVEGGWSPVAGSTCNASQAATPVTGSLTLTVSAPPPGEYRAAVAWGSGCQPKLPFHLSSCEKLGVARSGSFRVGSPPDTPR